MADKCLLDKALHCLNLPDNTNRADMVFVLLSPPDNNNLPSMEYTHFYLFPADNYLPNKALCCSILPDNTIPLDK